MNSLHASSAICAEGGMTLMGPAGPHDWRLASAPHSVGGVGGAEGEPCLAPAPPLALAAGSSWLTETVARNPPDTPREAGPGAVTCVWGSGRDSAARSGHLGACVSDACALLGCAGGTGIPGQRIVPARTVQPLLQQQRTAQQLHLLHPQQLEKRAVSYQGLSSPHPEEGQGGAAAPAAFLGRSAVELSQLPAPPLPSILATSRAAAGAHPSTTCALAAYGSWALDTTDLLSKPLASQRHGHAALQAPVSDGASGPGEPELQWSKGDCEWLLPKGSNVLVVGAALPPAMRRSVWSVSDYAVGRCLHEGYASKVRCQWL
jgi:hypothetical protein